MEGAWSYLYSRTALLLRIEMNILRVDKMRPLFQEAIVAKLAVTQRTTRYQLKAMDIIFPMMPHDYPWVKWFWPHSPAKLSIFPKKPLKTAPFSQALKTCFQKAVIRRPIKFFPWNQLQMAIITLNFQWKKVELIYLIPLWRYSKLKSGLILCRKFDSFKEIVQVNKAIYV